METPEEQGFCDFCKEPFRKKAPPPKPVQPAPIKVPPEVFQKLLEAKNVDKGDGIKRQDIPPEFTGLDSGGNIEGLPPYARKAAWAFLGLILLWSVVGTIYFAMRAKDAAEAPPRAPAPPRPG